MVAYLAQQLGVLADGRADVEQASEAVLDLAARARVGARGEIVAAIAQGDGVLRLSLDGERYTGSAGLVKAGHESEQFAYRQMIEFLIDTLLVDQVSRR
jgi:hypothetical protein